MDFKELLRIASENKERAKKQCAENKRYDTKVPPPKKEQKAVDPNAIRARLFQKEREKKEKAAEEERKKQELLKLRAASETGKRGKTKKVDVSSKIKTSSRESQSSHEDKRSSSSSRQRLSDGSEHRQKLHTSKHASNRYEDEEHEIRHQNFMEKVAKSAQKRRDSISDSDDDSDDDFDERESRKESKAQKKPSTLPKKPMSYDDILKLAAEKQKGGGQSGVSANVANQQDNKCQTNKITTSFNKKHKDKNDKHVTIGNGHLKEAAEKYKPTNSKAESGQSSSIKKSQNKHHSSENGRLKEVAAKYKQKSSKGDSGQSSGLQKSQNQKPPIGNGRLKEAAERYTPKSKQSKPNVSSAKERPQKTQVATQSRITDYTKKGVSRETTPRGEPQHSKKSVVGKKGVMSADQDRRRQVQSGDRGRPHSSQMSRDRPRDADFRRPVAKKRPAPPLPRMKAKHGRLLSDDESDYEEDGFIDDTPLEEEGADVSSYIKEIFGYDKSKYGYESDYALRFMDASYKDVQREEARSARLGMLEDLEDMRKEKEEEMRKKAKKKKR